MASSQGQMHVVYQAMAAIGVGLCTMVASISMGYTSPALPSMHKDPDFEISEEDGPWIGSVMPAFALVGSLLAGPLLDTVGRRATILLVALPFMISWAVIATAVGVRGVILGRMLSGTCVGVMAVAGSVFVPEMVQLNLRSKMVFFPSFLRNIGVFLTYAAGLYLSWREIAWLASLLCFLPVVLMLPLPETPFFLTQSGMRDSSLAALKQLRQTPQEVEKEQEALDVSCSSSKKGKVSLLELFQPPNVWPIAIGIGLMFAQQTTGISAVVFYSSAIFEAAGDSLNPGTASTLLGAMNVMGTFIGISLAARFRRRSMIILSTSLLMISLSILSAFFWAQEAGGWYSAIAKDFSIVPVIALLAYMAGFCCGWGPVPWIYAGEGMPSRVRGKAVSVIVAVNWTATFFVTKTFQLGISLIGIHYTFLGYAIITCINGSIIHRFMPETFRKSTAQMDAIYIEASKKKKQ